MKTTLQSMKKTALFLKKPVLVTVFASIAVAAALAATGAAFASGGEPMMYTTYATTTFKATYGNSADFLRNEGASCEVATDGCNTIMIDNGQLGASTMMYCAEIYAGREAWSCKKYAGQLSLDDQAKYWDLRATADATVLRAVNGFMRQFDAYAARMTLAQRGEFVTKIAQRADAAINSLFDRYAQGTVLASRSYAALKLVSLEMGRVK